MSKYIKVFFLISFTINIGFSKSKQPKIVVGLVVDQMRWDYLYKYYDRYGDNGFKRILKEGVSCENTTINYLPAHTAVGHASIYTGSIPAIHGIVGNKWINKNNGKSIYCTSDENTTGVGTTGNRGKHSPRNLLSSTITDELRLASNFQSKVIGVSIKDRGGILPAGRFSNATYWFEPSTGNWISSSYYMDDLPRWVTEFNNKNFSKLYTDKDWTLSFPSSTYKLSLSEDNPYKGIWPEQNNVFPHKSAEIVKQKESYSLMFTIPAGNTLTLDFSKNIIENESLGNNPKGATDFLAISLSSTDFIGHKFGISSMEIEDTYIKLDRDIGEFLEYLDQTIGENDYLLFLTADHGASYNPRYYSDIKGQAGYFPSKEIKNNINERILSILGVEEVIYAIENYQVYLDLEKLKQENLSVKEVKDIIRAQLKNTSGIAYVIDFEDNSDAAYIPKYLLERVVNGYHEKRSGHMQILVEPQWYDHDFNATGTEHGTWISYDTHIPLLFMGGGIKPGKIYRQINITDIAPTLSSLLSIMQPNGSIGVPIVELME